MTLQEILSIVSWVSFGIFGVLAVIAGVLFRSWKILDVHADLTGKKRAEGIEQILNESAAQSQRRKGKGMDALSTTGDLFTSGQIGEDSSEVVRLDTDATTVVEDDHAATSVLDEDRGATTVLGEDNDATTVIGDDSAETSVMGEAAGESGAAAAGFMQAGDLDQPDAAASDRSDANKQTDPKLTTVMKPLVIEKETHPETGKATGSAQEPWDGFRLVRKIVLTESRQYVRVEQGDRHAHT